MITTNVKGSCLLMVFRIIHLTKAMRSSLSFFLLFTAQVALSAQTYQVFEWTPTEGQGPILRLETYENDQLTQTKFFGEQTRLTSTIRWAYNDLGLLKERKQTFYETTEYDLIRQYTYDDEGRKIGELFGNNRTGKWGSFRYSYNANGDVDTIAVYQKNGDLTDYRIMEYTYDSTGRKTIERRLHQKASSGKVTVKTIIEYNYPDSRTVKTTFKDADGQLISEEVIRRTDFGEIALQQMTFPDLGTVKTLHFYNKKKQLIRTEEYDGERLVKKIIYEYGTNGKIFKKRITDAERRQTGEVYKLLP
ncbi:MAG: hypothetical protein AAF960_24695 [Bacteroidota bacterium]